MRAKRHIGITVVSVLMIIFGLAEVATGFTHNFLGILTTAPSILATYGAVAVGGVYAISGLLLLTMKKDEAYLALICLLFVIIGRVMLVAVGIYPIGSAIQIASIVIGTILAIIFFVYIKSNLKEFN